MTRLVLAILLALSLATTPSPAFSAPSAGCSMEGAAAGMAADHEKMSCCTPDCAISCPAGVLPLAGINVPDAVAVAPLNPVSLIETLHSINPGSTDPPPRMTSLPI